MSQWGVSVLGSTRPRTTAVHSVTNQVWGLPPEDFGRPWPLTVTIWPVLRPWLGVTLTKRPDVPAWAGNAGTATPTAPARATSVADHRCMPTTSEPAPEETRAMHLSTGHPAIQRAPALSAGRTPAMGLSANLTAHPFGGGVIGN